MNTESEYNDYAYPGTELDLFVHARRWRSYWLSRIAPLIRSDVLEVGAGIGTITREAAPSAGSWLALEPDPRLASQIGRGGSNLTVRVGDIGALASDEYFDAILYIDVIEHIEHDVDELGTAAQHLTEGGHLIVLAPAFPSLYSCFDAAVGHHRRYTRRGLLALRPPGLLLRRVEHLDVMGLLISAVNRAGRDQDKPERWQIAVWDRFLIPLSGSSTHCSVDALGSPCSSSGSAPEAPASPRRATCVTPQFSGRDLGRSRRRDHARSAPP